MRRCDEEEEDTMGGIDEGWVEYEGRYYEGSYVEG